MFMKTVPVIHSYSKKFNWFLYLKGKHVIRVCYYHGLVFGGIDQHTIASVPFVCDIELMQSDSYNKVGGHLLFTWSAGGALQKFWSFHHISAPPSTYIMTSPLGAMKY